MAPDLNPLLHLGNSKSGFRFRLSGGNNNQCKDQGYGFHLAEDPTLLERVTTTFTSVPLVCQLSEARYYEAHRHYRPAGNTNEKALRELTRTERNKQFEIRN